jgi:hypothetical protein
VLGADGRAAQDSHWQKNLILDQGLNKVATVQFNQLFAACAIGTDTSPTTIRPAALARITAQTVQTTAPTFSNADLDSDIRFDTGEYFKIQSVTDPQTAIVFPPGGSIATNEPFTILRTNQTILGNEIKRTVTCLQVPNANRTIDNTGTLVFQRTFIFPPETTTITYTEIGFSDISTPGANLFSRILLAAPVTVSGPVAELGGQQLQVTYQLSIGFDYGRGSGIFFSGSTPTNIAITGLPINYPIWQYEGSPLFPGKLEITCAPPIPSLVGQKVVVSGSSNAAYNGTWTILETHQVVDTTKGPSSVLALNVPYTTSPTITASDQVTTVMTGAFFRPCYGIFRVGPTGGSVGPPHPADVFWGYGEPSLAGQAWVATDSASTLGSNGSPKRALSPTFAACQLSPYTQNNFYRDQTALFTIADNNPISSFGYGLADLTNQIETWAFDSPHALGANSQLQLVFRFSWNRTSF